MKDDEDADIISGSIVEIARGEVRRKNLVLFGGRIKMYGAIHGDLVLFGGRHEIDGKIHGDMFLVGGKARLQRNTDISGNMDVLGGSLTREKDSRVRG